MADEVKNQEAPTALSQAISVLESTKEDLQQLLADQHEMVLIGINTKLDLMANQLRMMSGVNTNTVIGSKKSFAPVTTFMGEQLKTPKDVTAEDVNIGDVELKIFREKVDKLQADFPNLNNDQILDSFKTEQNVVRGVAKRAGLTDYKTTEINDSTLDLIRVGLKAQAELNEQKVATEASIANASKPSDVKVTTDEEDEDEDEDTTK